MRSGIGHTTRALADALVDVDPDLELVLFAMSAGRGPGLEDASRHPRMRVRGGRPWVRGASWFWWRTELPPVELFCGRADVFHGPNYLLPPMRRAAGVLTIHDTAFYSVPEMCSAPVLRIGGVLPRTAARARRIICTSRFIADEVAKYLPHLADRVRVVPLAVREEFFDPKPLLPAVVERYGARDPYAVFLGNVEIRKGVDLLLDSFDVVRKRLPDARLVVIGQPSVRWDEIAAQRSSLLSSGAVTVAGYVSDDDAASLVAGARVLVYPTRYEGFGLPPLEAMACGTPAITSTAPPLLEIAQGVACQVDVTRTDDLIDALYAALTTSPAAAEIEAARTHARRFNWRRTAAETLNVYREAMER